MSTETSEIVLKRDDDCDQNNLTVATEDSQELSIEEAVSTQVHGRFSPGRICEIYVSTRRSMHQTHKRNQH